MGSTQSHWKSCKDVAVAPQKKEIRAGSNPDRNPPTRGKASSCHSHPRVASPPRAGLAFSAPLQFEVRRGRSPFPWSGVDRPCLWSLLDPTAEAAGAVAHVKRIASLRARAQRRALDTLCLGRGRHSVLWEGGAPGTFAGSAFWADHSRDPATSHPSGPSAWIWQGTIRRSDRTAP